MSISSIKTGLLMSNGGTMTMEIPVSESEADCAFWGKVGWARFARMVVLTKEHLKTPVDTGPLLFAEWLEADGTSCRIAPHPAQQGKRQKIIFPSHDELLECERAQVQGHGAAKNRKLYYDIYWSDDGEGRVRRAFDVFRGFADDEGTAQ